MYEASQKYHKWNFFAEYFGKTELSSMEEAYFATLESELLQIEATAWPLFLQKCLPQICNHDPKHLWANLWNTWNEVKGYIELKTLGAVQLEFIQENSGKTPDIKGLLGGSPVLLEVKNVNRSDNDIFATVFPELQIIDVEKTLCALIKKIKSLYHTASQQMIKYEQHNSINNAEKICYFVIDTDIMSHSLSRTEITQHVDLIQRCSPVKVMYTFLERRVR